MVFFLRFCVVCAGILSARRIIRAAGRIVNMSILSQIRNRWRRFSMSKQRLREMFLLLGSLTFVSGCAKNTPLLIESPCAPIYGHVSDWDVVSDDLARNIYRHNLLCEQLKKETI